MSHQKGFAHLILILSVIVIFIIGLAYLFFIYLPHRQTNEFLTSSKEVVSKLEEEIESFKETFNAAKNIKLDFDEAKRALVRSTFDFEDTKEEINSLKTEYQKVKATKKVVQLDKDINEQFTLIDELLNEYEKDLKYRDDVFKAWGDKIQNEFDNFSYQYYSGGDRVDFILKAELITSLSQQSLYALDNINIPESQKADFDYRKAFMTEINTNFKLLANYYRQGDDEKASETLSAMSQRLEDMSKEFEKTVDEYTKDSPVAKKLKEIEEKFEKIKKLY